MEVEYRVPEIDSIELKRRIDSGEKLVIMDTRTPEEYQNFSIPGGRSVPNGELALHVTDILNEHGPDTTLILNCAGRTRSIIGARALQRMGVPNVYGLKNGTAGWVLAGLELETRADRLSLPTVSEEGEARAATYAGQAAMEDGVQFLDIHELKQVMARAHQETVYLVDVRREEEYRDGHIPGFRWFPGRSGCPARRRRCPRPQRHHSLHLRRACPCNPHRLLVPTDGLPKRLRPPERHNRVDSPGRKSGRRYARIPPLRP